MNNHVFDSSNNSIDVTLDGDAKTKPVLGGVPLGVAAGELGVKVLVVGGSEVASVTPNPFAVTAGSTTVIPIGAIGASIIILTGTGTLNGVDQPALLPWYEPNKLAAIVTLILGTPGTARVYYGT